VAAAAVAEAMAEIAGNPSDSGLVRR